MSAISCKSFPEVIDMLSKCCPKSGEETCPPKNVPDDQDSDDDDICDMDELEEVFADHLFMGKRLRKRLYAGDFEGINELPDHPPIALTGLALELFSKAVPNYGLDILDMDYVATASEAARISPCAMILAMIYLERLKIKNSEYLEMTSPSGLFVVTMLVASKFLFEDEEDLVTNQLWAEELNLDVKELNSSECEFLSAIDWKVFVKSSDFFNYLADIEKVVAIRQSSQRGWLSYSDIYVMVQDPVFRKYWSWVIERLAKVTLLWTFGYVASVLALYATGIALQKAVRPAKYPVNFDLSKDNSTGHPPVHTNFQTSIHISNQHTSNPELAALGLSINKEQKCLHYEEQRIDLWMNHMLCPPISATNLSVYDNYALKTYSSGTLMVYYTPYLHDTSTNEHEVANNTPKNNYKYTSHNVENQVFSFLWR